MLYGNQQKNVEPRGGLIKMVSGLASTVAQPLPSEGSLKEQLSSSSDGLIKAVGPADVIGQQYSDASFDKVIDATGMCVLPGEYQLCEF